VTYSNANGCRQGRCLPRTTLRSYRQNSVAQPCWVIKFNTILMEASTDLSKQTASGTKMSSRVMKALPEHPCMPCDQWTRSSRTTVRRNSPQEAAPFQPRHLQAHTPAPVQHHLHLSFSQRLGLLAQQLRRRHQRLFFSLLTFVRQRMSP